MHQAIPSGEKLALTLYVTWQQLNFPIELYHIAPHIPTIGET